MKRRDRLLVWLLLTLVMCHCRPATEPARAPACQPAPCTRQLPFRAQHLRVQAALA